MRDPGNLSTNDFTIPLGNSFLRVDGLSGTTNVEHGFFAFENLIHRGFLIPEPPPSSGTTTVSFPLVVNGTELSLSEDFTFVGRTTSIALTSVAGLVGTTNLGALGTLDVFSRHSLTEGGSGGGGHVTYDFCLRLTADACTLRQPGQSVPLPDMLWPTALGMLGLAGVVAWRQRSTA